MFHLSGCPFQLDHYKHLAQGQGSGLGRQEEVGMVHGMLRRWISCASVHPGVAPILSLAPKSLMKKLCAVAT